jgi:outer membrane biosynthesis protein TonB
MREAVGTILEMRAPVPTGLSRLVSFSFAAHVMLAAGILIWQAWFSKPADDKVMMITLSGSPGPSTGFTPVGGKQVDEVVPEPKRPTPTPVPTTSPTEMALPSKPTTKTPPPKKDSTSQVSSVVRPSTGSQVATGSSVIDTGSRGQGVGLSQGGGAGASPVTVDPDFQFCCSAYLSAMTDEIRKHINFNVGGHGLVVVKFEIARDGSIARTTIGIEKTSRVDALDNEALFGVRQAKLPPLPGEYKPNTLKVMLSVQF